MHSEPSRSSKVEMLVEWEGRPIHHPGVLFEESHGGDLSSVEDVNAIAGWIAVTALSRMGDNPVSDAIKRKVIGFLKGWRARFGQEKLDEVKKQLLVEVQKYGKNRKITDQELNERIELLFAKIDE